MAGFDVHTVQGNQGTHLFIFLPEDRKAELGQGGDSEMTTSVDRFNGFVFIAGVVSTAAGSCILFGVATTAFWMGLAAIAAALSYAQATKKRGKDGN